MGKQTTPSTSWAIDVGDGETRAVFEPARQPLRDAVLLVAHGAGSNMDHRATVGLAAEMRRRGLHTVRFDFLYRALGKGRPDPMPKLTACYAAVVETVRREIDPPHVFIGGRSMGGRAASMMAAEGFACDGLVLFAYPLHPPGRPEKKRDAHLGDIATPVLCFNGTRDDFCGRDLMEQVLETLPETFAMHWIEGADHGFHVLKRSGRTDPDVLEEVGQTTAAWVARVLE